MLTINELYFVDVVKHVYRLSQDRYVATIAELQQLIAVEYSDYPRLIPDCDMLRQAVYYLRRREHLVNDPHIFVRRRTHNAT